MNTTQTGKIAEQAAVDLYRKNNFKILARNFRNPKGLAIGEIDFIASKNKHLHFVEIKARSSQNFGTAAESLTYLKRARIIKTAKYFLTIYPYFTEFAMHFDLVAVDLNQFDKLPQRIRIYSDVIDDIN